MIPLATTTISATRVPADPTRDGYDTAPAPISVATGVRAVINPPSASVNLTTGERIAYHHRLVCDIADLQADDTVTDADGNVYTLEWVKTIRGLGLDHMEGSLMVVVGASS